MNADQPTITLTVLPRITLGPLLLNPDVYRSCGPERLKFDHRVQFGPAAETGCVACLGSLVDSPRWRSIRSPSDVARIGSWPPRHVLAKPIRSIVEPPARIATVVRGNVRLRPQA